MPKDIKREVSRGPGRFDEIMEKPEIIANKMMADDGQVPMDLGNIGTHDTMTTQSDSDTSNDMSFYDVCAIDWRRVQSQQGSWQEMTERIKDVTSWKRS